MNIASGTVLDMDLDLSRVADRKSSVEFSRDPKLLGQLSAYDKVDYGSDYEQRIEQENHPPQVRIGPRERQRYNAESNQQKETA